MKEINVRSALVIFGQDLPKKKKSWWRQFNKIIAPKNLQEKIQSKGVDFVDIESLIGYGSIQEANRLVNELPRLILANGRPISKLIIWQGYELWWMHYNDLMHKFCLPYTQYHGLLQYLKDFNKVCLYQAPWPHLFRYFLKANNCRCNFLNRLRLGNLLPISCGTLIQFFLSAGFLLWLKIIRPPIMIRTSDKFNPPHDFDFRQRIFYEELRKKNLPFVEFIRSMESWLVVLKHAWRRKRPVVYSTAIIDVVHFFARYFGRNKKKESDDLLLSSGNSPEKRFQFLIAAHYFNNLKGTIWSIRLMKFILQWIGVKSAIITAGDSRSFHEILGCKIAEIKTIGVQHSATPRHYFVSDFMPEFDGEKSISLDIYGLWSNWWKEYYLTYSRVFKAEQLFVSGPIRPLEKEIISTDSRVAKNGPLKVLFISEQLADPKEIMPYLLALLAVKDFAVSLKIRPQHDGFMNWLENNDSNILEEVRVLGGDIHKAISESDVVVGSHSTAVLETLWQLKPPVFFKTERWGDYFEIKAFDVSGRFFAENPQELINCLRKITDVPKEDLKQLQERFFGDPNKNGGRWVVEQALEFAKNYGK